MWEGELHSKHVAQKGVIAQSRMVQGSDGAKGVMEHRGMLHRGVCCMWGCCMGRKLVHGGDGGAQRGMLHGGRWRMEEDAAWKGMVHGGCGMVECCRGGGGAQGSDGAQENVAQGQWWCTRVVVHLGL